MNSLLNRRWWSSSTEENVKQDIPFSWDENFHLEIDQPMKRSQPDHQRPLQANHKATNFFRQPNELCQVTISEDHDSFSETTIEEQVLNSLLNLRFWRELDAWILCTTG